METPYAIRKYKIVNSWLSSEKKQLKVLITEYLENVEYFGVDVDPGNISQLKEKGINFIASDFNKDDFASQITDRYDYILILDVLEHLADPSKVIQNCKSLLNSTGKFLISIPNDYHILNKIRFVFNKKIALDPFDPYGHLHVYPINAGRDFLKSQNLDIVKELLLYPEKPSMLPESVRRNLCNVFPNDFARGVLYELKIRN
jgi:SAM-dependent methyltransferase